MPINIYSFFKRDTSIVNHDDEFNQLVKAVDELIISTEFAYSSTSISNYCLSFCNATYNKIAELFTFTRHFNASSINFAGLFMTVQIFMCLLQGAYAQTNTTLHQAALEQQFNITDDSLVSQGFNITHLQKNLDFYPYYEPNDVEVIEKSFTSLSAQINQLIQRAHYLLDRAIFNEALAIAAQIKAIEPNHPEIYFITASVLLEQDGNYPQALEQFSKACELEPTNKKYRLFKRVAEYFNSPQNTLSYYLEADHFDPLTMPTKRFIPPKQLFCTMNEVEFIASICRASFNKQQVNKLLAKADDFHKHDNLIEALKYYDKVLAHIPTADPVYNSILEYLYLQKSIIYLTLQHYEYAEQSLKLVVALNTKPEVLTDIYFEYGNTLINLFNISIQNSAEDLILLEKTVIAYDKARKLRPEYTAFAERYAEAYALLNNWQAIKSHQYKQKL